MRAIIQIQSLAAVALLALAATALGAAPGGEQFLKGADARIEQIRKSDGALRLCGPDGAPLPQGTKVRIEQTCHEFLFGCNLFGLVRREGGINEDYAERFAGMFNFATLPFYWWAYERERGNVEAGQRRAEVMAAWCREHGITAKGHALVYNLGDPAWAPQETAELRQAQLERITREASHFKGAIKYWDVANEITMFDRETTRMRAPRLTKAITEAGTIDFIKQAFKLTRAADPEAGLIINDYVTDKGYADTVIAKLVDENNKPLYDVIGVQSHQHGRAWSVEQIWTICERFARFGKPVHFTETTFTSGKEGIRFDEHRSNPEWVTTPEGERRQAENVVRFYTMLFSHPAVEAITWWDLSDRGAWMQAPSGLLRADMSSKPAYEELKKLIKGKWWTKEKTTVERGGTVKLRGFRGDYQVTATGPDGKEIKGSFKLEKTGPETIEVKLK